ncbi:FAD/NAD(P)-binding domain-containing protein [Linnemannia elongata AG-77]|uniref:FAD/NAD(P)-binding domain-containing protein n=1 Tax=Linnemannia elongata AG-77 TaxID=1314771 RepID=A0A197JWS2_9FUNG|nr:FAD/NAD(P)-binding domain-containing protein [Linnemannia elongata AG-77]
MSASAENTTYAAPSDRSLGNNQPPARSDKPLHVVIAGAGLAGLFLGILLEKAGISYEIFERSAKIKPLGAIMCLTPNILAAIEQLGLYEELLSFSKPLRDCGYLLTDKLEHIAHFESLSPEIMGYERQLFPRPELHHMLLSKVPVEKIHFSSKVSFFEQSQDGVIVTFENNTTARGDILIGADGARSSVRQHLYKTLDKEGLLPKSDNQDMKRGFISLLGTTSVLDPAKYPDVLKEDCQSYGIVGDGGNPYTWATFTVPGNRICWNVVVQLGVNTAADEQFECSDWVPQQNQGMMDSIRHFKTTYGTLGDLFDATPIDVVSKVYFEDMLFETWNHGRTVLIGDAAHKLLPSTGAGAVNAMQDAVILANHIYDIRPTSFENIKAALHGYKAERFDAVKDQYSQTHMAARLQFGHTWWERALRHILFNWIPRSMQSRQMSKEGAYRPQANFLPQAPRRGTLDVIPQKPSKRIQREQEEAKKIATAAAIL